MRIFISLNSKIKEIEVTPSTLIEDVKALVEVELGVAFSEQMLMFKNQTLVDTQKISFYKIQNGDTIIVQKVSYQSMNNFNFGNFFNMNQNPLMNPTLVAEAKKIKELYQNNPSELQFILHQKPDFAQAVLSDDITVLTKLISDQKQREYEKKIKEMEKIAQLNSDPFNPENQKFIEEAIRQNNVDENLELAQEYMPESFGQITMLYINIKINKFPIQAFVDSGAQSTIMSKGYAEKCGIMRMVDTRFQGTALGVGQSRIIGRVHAVDMQIGDRFFTCSLTILDDDKVDFLFGLDMLKRHECLIDLKKNKLVFGDSGIEVAFLSEGEIKRTITSAFLENEEKKEIENAVNISKKENKPTQVLNKPPPSSPNLNLKEEDIKKLMNLSFPRDKAIRALTMAGGNVEVAASLLFNNSI